MATSIIDTIKIGSNTYPFKSYIAYGTCDTAAGTAAKVVTLSANTAENWVLETGSIVTVKFTNTNTAASPTLNVNNTGAKSIYYNNAVYTSSSSYGGYAKRSITYQYDGTYWVFISWGYDTNSDTKVTQAAAITTAKEYPVLLGYSDATTSVTNTVNKTSTLKYNPSTQTLTVPNINGITSTELGYLSGVASNIQTQLNGKLNKLTYEWNKQYNAGGTAGYLLIGSFPMYDTNVTIDIDATTNTTYHGTIVIATQNVSETSIGTAHVITVYGDPTGTISDAIRVVWNSGSRNYNVYFVPATWSKNFIHIRAIGNYMENIDESKICTQFTTGTAPTTTSGLTVVNALTSAFNKYTLPAATSSTLGGVKIGSNITVSSGTISLTKANVTAALGYTPPTSDTNTTYTFATGDSNGQIKVTPSGGSAQNMSVKGLGSAAYTASTAYAAASHGTHLTIGTTATTAAAGNHTHSHNHPGETIKPICLEFQPTSSAGHGGYLDFHYNNSTSDYTSRIIESASGQLSFLASNGIVLTTGAYGTSLPAAGKAGRIFFKKV